MRVLHAALLLTLLTTVARAFESGCTVGPDQQCLPGAATARTPWTGGPAGRADAAEHLALFEAIHAESGVPRRAIAPLRWTQYTDGHLERFVTPTQCKLPEDERDFGEWLADAVEGVIGAVLDPGAVLEELLEAPGRTLRGLMADVGGAVENCIQGTCVPQDGLGEGIGVCVWEGPSHQPVAFDQVAAQVRRTRSPAELTQLPDYGWSLHDLLTGFETCPVDIPGGDVVDCHTFSRHMGAYNSSHFPPQSQDFYRHYHQLAVDRAAACASQSRALPEDARFERFKSACLGEAMAYEAIAQHFLQDAWSMGHLWQRWGAPEPSRSVSYARAHLVALTAGMLHGTKSVICVGAFCPDDAMNAPHPDVHWQGEGDLHAGVGDLFLDTLLTDEAYAVQRARLFACGAGSLRAVYRAAGEPLGALGPGPAGADDVDPTSDACFGQRATNVALYAGAGINGEVAGVNFTVTLDDLLTQAVVLQVSQSKAGPSGDLSNAQVARLTAEYQVDMAAMLLTLKIAQRFAPDDTHMADGGLPSLLGSTPNGQNRVDGPPASFVDQPAMADPRGARTADADRKHALHASYATEWCAAFDGSDPAYDLETLRARVENTRDAVVPDDVPSIEAARAACAVCLDFAERHARVGAGADAYDADREPLCHYLAPDAAQFVYVPDDECFGRIPEFLRRSPAERYCGCLAPGTDHFRLHGAHSTGDPHITTIDGLAYDFQAAGEFLLVGDGAGINIQVRQEAASEGVCEHISVNTAVSTRIGGVRVSLFLDSPDQIWIDGVPQQLEAFLVFDDCARLARIAGGYAFFWPTGESLVVNQRTRMFNLDFAAAPDRPGAYSGLLGDGDGDPRNDLRDADGAVIEVEPLTQSAVYDQLRPAWLVGAERLFEDRPGEGPGVFDEPAFPIDVVEVFEAGERAVAQARCRDAGVVAGRIDECALDVLCMGEDAIQAFVGQTEPALRAPIEAELPDVDATCLTRGYDVVSAEGPRRSQVNCEPGCEDAGSVWGTDIYTNDSRVCRAAIHAGHLNIGEAGSVYIAHRPGQLSYEGSERNGVVTSDYGEWRLGSFVFIDAP